MDRKERTLIVARKTRAESNAAFVGVMLETLARSRASIAVFSEKRASSRHLVAMVETQNSS